MRNTLFTLSFLLVLIGCRSEQTINGDVSLNTPGIVEDIKEGPPSSPPPSEDSNDAIVDDGQDGVDQVDTDTDGVTDNTTTTPPATDVDQNDDDSSGFTALEKQDMAMVYAAQVLSSDLNQQFFKQYKKGVFKSTAASSNLLDDLKIIMDQAGVAATSFEQADYEQLLTQGKTSYSAALTVSLTLATQCADDLSAMIDRSESAALIEFYENQLSDCQRQRDALSRQL